MASKLVWTGYAIDYVLRNKLSFYKNKYCKRLYVDNNEGSRKLAELIISGKPFMAGRMGLFEVAAMRMYEFNKKNKYKIVLDNIYNCAGFFPNDTKLGYKFLEISKAALKETDILASNRQLCENYFINQYMPKNSMVTESLELFDVCKLESSWSKVLKGKKVLVVTPFDESVKHQYEIREKLFPGDEEILPEFELITYKSLMTVGDMKDERFASWFEALEYMKKEILEINFDIAILGCGAYGFPLAAAIKRAGKSAIHMGGALQILFGIMGKRWDGTRTGNEIKIRDDIARFYNENWIYPLEARPEGADKVEYGPYWK